MKLLISLFFSFIFFLGFSQTYSLKDFYKSDTVLDNKIDSIFNLLNDTSRVGQMIVPAIGRLGKSRDHVLALAQKGWIGGILLLNGTFEEFSKDVKIAYFIENLSLIYISLNIDKKKILY